MRPNLFLFIIFAIVISACSEKKTTEPNDIIEDTFLTDVNSYLSTNSFAIDPDDFNSLTALPDSLIKNSLIILTGENHGVIANTQLKLAFLKYLNSEYGVRNIILELGYSTAKYFQEYISGGDISILQHVFDYLEGTIYYSKEQYRYWQDVKTFNSTLPENGKLRLFGIDVEHQYTTAITYLESHIPEQNPPQEIFYYFTELKNIVDQMNYDRSYIKSFCRDFINDLTNNYDIYSSYLGNEKIIDFELILRGIDAAFTWYDEYEDNYSAGYNFRDNYMFSVFKISANSYEGEKFFGQLGINHILQQNLNGVNWFAALLNSDIKYTTKIFSIPYFYQNCRAMGYITGDYYEYFLSTVGEGFDFLTETNTGNVSLFNLAGNNSPLSDESYLHYYLPDGPYPTDFAQVMTNYFQSAVLIKFSDAMKPLN